MSRADFIVAGLMAGLGFALSWNVTGWIQKKWRDRED